VADSSQKTDVSSLRLSEGDVSGRWRSHEPLVSVLCATYNHQDFVVRAIEGILRQQTDFRFEILIRDDASTDETASILRRFQETYPSIIRVQIEGVNRYHETSAYDVLVSHARGKYVATCEGDDYWTDSTKLQVQVEALQANPDAVAAFHRVDTWDEATQSFIQPTYRTLRDYSQSEWLRDPSLPSQSLLFRNVVPAYPPEFPRIANTDTYIQVRLALQGGAIYIPSLDPSVYRIHDRGTWSQLSSRGKAAAQAQSFYWIACQLIDEGRYREGKRFLSLASQAILDSHLDVKVDPRGTASLRNMAITRRLVQVARERPRLIGTLRRLQRFGK